MDVALKMFVDVWFGLAIGAVPGIVSPPAHENSPRRVLAPDVELPVCGEGPVEGLDHRRGTKSLTTDGHDFLAKKAGESPGVDVCGVYDGVTVDFGIVGSAHDTGRTHLRPNHINVFDDPCPGLDSRSHEEFSGRPGVQRASTLDAIPPRETSAAA